MFINAGTIEKPRITAIVPWFGSKRTLAPTIVEELGPHRSYWEPFCGSMAVLFAKPPAGQETVNDLHGDLVNLAMVLASGRYADLAERLARTLCHEEMFDAALDQLAQRSNETPLFGDGAVEPPVIPEGVECRHLDRAYWFFVASWLGRNGTAGTRDYNHHVAVRWTPSGGSTGTRWANAVQSIPWWHERLARVSILRRDAFEVIAKIADQDGSAIYVDPPYLADTRGTGRKGRPSGGGSNYFHDFAERDHARLAVALARFKSARVVVSYYDDPRLDALYAGWTKRLVYRQKNLHVQNRRGEGNCTAPEVLFITGPSKDAGS